MPNYKVFVSYAHEDEILQLLAVATIGRVPGAVAVYDECSRGLGYAEGVEPRLTQMITEADCVLFLVSKSALDSTWVAWEANVAAKRGKRMFWICPDDLEALLPPPLRDIKGVPHRPGRLREPMDEFEAWLRRQVGAHMTTPPLPDAPSSDSGTTLVRLASGPLLTEFGQWAIHAFHDGNEQALVLAMGELRSSGDVLCRIHSECLTSHIFFATECDCAGQMRKAQRLIAQEGVGLIIYLQQEGRGNGAAAHIATLELKNSGMDQLAAYNAVGFRDDVRRYDIAAKILHSFHIASVRLIGANKHKEDALRRAKIAVTEHKYHGGTVIELGRSLRNFTSDVRSGAAHSPVWAAAKSRVLVVGDLNVDFIIPERSFHADGIIDAPRPAVGGTAYNAAKHFRDADLNPVLFGRVGGDAHGKLIEDALSDSGITSLVARDAQKQTGTATLVYGDSGKRIMVQHGESANDYNLSDIEQALVLSRIGADDIVFLVGHPFVRQSIGECRQLLEMLCGTKARVVLDIVPHNMHERLEVAAFEAIAHGLVHGVIGETETIAGLCGVQNPRSPGDHVRVMEAVFQRLGARLLVLRYGRGGIEKQDVLTFGSDGIVNVLERIDTNYLATPPARRSGFGDRLTAAVLVKHRDTFMSVAAGPVDS